MIIEEDCGTDRALEMRAIVQGGAVIASLADRVLGRTTAEDIVDAKTGESIIAEGELLDEAMVAKIEEIGLQGVQDPLAAGLRVEAGRLRQVLRARPRPRHAGQHRRGGRRHRRPVDRRAGHPADDADLPHRRRGAAQRAVEPRSAGRRHDRVPRHADDRRPARPAPVAVALGRDRDPRHGRPRALDAPRALRRAPAVRERPYRQPRRPHRRVGSVVQPGDHREGRYREVPGPDREPDDDRAGRRIDRHRPARGHRRHAPSRRRTRFIRA